VFRQLWHDLQILAGTGPHRVCHRKLGKEGYYTANMEMSADGRFIYYIRLSEPQAKGVPSCSSTHEP